MMCGRNGMNPSASGRRIHPLPQNQCHKLRSCGSTDRTHKRRPAVVRVGVLGEHIPSAVTKIALAVGRQFVKELDEKRVPESEAAAEHLLSGRARDIDSAETGRRKR